MYTKKRHEEFLNRLGASNGLSAEWFQEWHPTWIKSRKDAMLASESKLGSLMRKHDPIMFKVNKQEKEKQ